MLRVLMRRPSKSLSRAELTHVKRQIIDTTLAASQHQAYRLAVGSLVNEVIELPELEDYPDSVFVEDTLLAFPECYVLTRPGAISRRNEPTHIHQALPADRPIFRIQEPATMDGGDVLTIGKSVFVGISTRTTADAVAELRSLLRPFGYTVTGLSLGQALHLKTAVTALDDTTVVMNPHWIRADLFAGYRIIKIAPDEPFAANILNVRGTRFIQQSCTETAAQLQHEGYEVRRLEISEFAKAEAGLTCMSVVIPPPG